VTQEKDDAESRWTQRAVSVIVILTALFALYGTNAKVSNLEARVSALDIKLQSLEAVGEQVDTLTQQIDTLQDSVDQLALEVGDIQSIRDDVVRAIRQALRER
jgi:TolA-binding protein